MARVVKKLYVNLPRNKLQRSRTNPLLDKVELQRDNECVLWFDLLDDDDPQASHAVDADSTCQLAFDASTDALGSDLVTVLDASMNDVADRSSVDLVDGKLCARVVLTGDVLEKFMEFKPQVELRMTLWVQEPLDSSVALFQVPVTVINAVTEVL